MPATDHYGQGPTWDAWVRQIMRETPHRHQYEFGFSYEKDETMYLFRCVLCDKGKAISKEVFWHGDLPRLIREAMEYELLLRPRPIDRTYDFIPAKPPYITIPRRKRRWWLLWLA